MRRFKTKVLPGESKAFHRKLDEILEDGDTDELLLLLCLLLELRPFSRRKVPKTKGQPVTAAPKNQT